MRSIIALLFLSAIAFGFNEKRDSLTLEQRVTRLERAFDSMQVASAKYAMKKDDENPLSTGKYLEWGKGFSVQIQKGTYAEVEAGYTFKAARHFRFGVSGGTGLIVDGTMGNSLPNLIAYYKTSVGTPVLLNFIGINTWYKLIYNVPYTITSKGSRGNKKGGEQLGIDFELWVSQNFCSFFGGNSILNWDEKTGTSAELGLKYSFGKTAQPKTAKKK